MEYERDLMTVHVLDALHGAGETRFEDTRVRLRIRPEGNWRRLFAESGFLPAEFFGAWSGAVYDIAAARRLIAVATR